MRRKRIALGVWSFLPAVLALWMAGHAAWRYFPGEGRVPSFQSAESLRLELTGAVAAALVATGCAGVVNLVLCGARRWHWRVMCASMLLATPIATLSPIGMLVMLPMEDPYTGGGALPIVAIAIVFGFVFFGAVFTVPVMIGVWRRWELTARVVRKAPSSGGAIDSR